MYCVREISQILYQYFNSLFHLVATQLYNTGSHEEYVIVGNDVLLKCTIPSFVADFLTVVGWVDSEGNEYLSSNIYGN